MSNRYNAKTIEKKWQEKWEHKNPFAADDRSEKKKCYVLDMFPYPSADGLHVGHVENYTATDIYSRYKKMNGFEVMHPIGWDAFGLPAENFAIKTGVHPDQKTHENIKNFTRQIKSLGVGYDWNREIDTSSPEYYRWTQWFFLFLYKNGLAYRKQASVNWCPSCQTVLANEQVVDGVCERCKTEVVQKDLKQWFFKITDFIEDQEYEGRNVSGLISGLDKIDWPESTKTAQKHWIGRSEGTTVKFKIQSTINSQQPVDEEFLEVFTTRVDTIFGCTYVVVAPEHPLVKKFLACHAELVSASRNIQASQELNGVLNPPAGGQDDSDKDARGNALRIKNIEEVEKYLEETKKKTELERTELAKEKTGVKLEDIEAINPFTGEAVPVFVADYVLGNYGTGAVMAVPAHDERDLEFAKKYVFGTYPIAVLPVAVKDMKGNIFPDYVVRINHGESIFEAEERCLKETFNDLKKQKVCGLGFKGDGILVDSGEFSDLTSEEARRKMTAWLEENNLGAKKVNYRLRDWLVSRQRYWGAPIPIIYCDTCGEQPVSEQDLPVKLPTDVDFRPTGESPLTRSESFHDVKCPKCGEKARRESDTMDTFVCSSWYYLRFADPKNSDVFANAEMLKKWLPVDMYMGGAEHTVLHLLYARFFTKALRKFGYMEFDEPFLKLRHQGMVLAEDGRKMSKSLGNVINPDDVVSQFGADSLRLYEMFMGPIEDAKQWSTGNIVGPRRFLEKVWRMQSKINQQLTINKNQESTKDFSKNLLHKTLKKVTEDIEEFRFNTCISSLMVLANEMDKDTVIAKEDFEVLLLILSPFAPHITEELWESLEHTESIFLSEWPEYDEKYLVDETVEIVVQVNGKLRAKVSMPVGSDQKSVEEKAMQDEKIALHTQGRTVRKVIYVPDKLMNIVVG